MQYGLIIGVMLAYFYTVSCVFFTVQIARLKGLGRGWGWLGLFLGLVGLIMVCFLPNAKGVTGETNPVRAVFRRFREISPVASWIVVAGLVLVIGGTLAGNRLVMYFENRSYARALPAEGSAGETTLSPSTVSGKVTAVFAGIGSHFAVTQGGDLYGWGAISQLTPLDESGRLYQKVMKAQTVGDTCFLLTADHVLYGKGDNSRGLIPGRTATQVADFVVIERDVRDFSACETAAALVKQSGNLYIWGSNTYGQLGREAERVTDTETRIAFGVAKVCVTPRSVYYMTEKGDVFAVGNNAYGQFGLGNRENQPLPVQIGSGCADFAAGTDFTLLLYPDGRLVSAGNDAYGQLGRVTAEETPPDSAGKERSDEEESAEGKPAGTDVFAPVEAPEGVTRVFAGGSTAFCMVGSEVYAWGENTLGQLGTGDRDSRDTPDLVHRKAATLSAGGGATLLLTEDGKLLGAGDRRYYQLGPRESGDGFREIADISIQ